MTTTLPEMITDAAGPLADVAHVLGSAPGTLSPGVTAAALILAAEQLTSECEACWCATAKGDLCGPCSQRSAAAFAHRELADRLQHEVQA